MKALILAVGKGTRLNDLTKNRPKPMLPVGDKPLLEHLIQWLRRYGITDIAMNLHYQPRVVTDYFGNGEAFGVQLTYSHETELLGTAGAAKQLEWFLDEPFVVVYGDIFTNVNLSRLCALHRAPTVTSGLTPLMTLALYHVDNPTACGIVGLDEHDQVRRFVEKPREDAVFSTLANAGILLCDPVVLASIPSGIQVDFGHDVLPKFLDHPRRMVGRIIDDTEYVIDIGTPAGYARAQMFHAAQRDAELPHDEAGQWIAGVSGPRLPTIDSYPVHDMDSPADVPTYIASGIATGTRATTR